MAGIGSPWPEHLCPGRALGQEPSSGLPPTEGASSGGHSERHPGMGPWAEELAAAWGQWRPQLREVARPVRPGTETTGGGLHTAGVTLVQGHPSGIRVAPGASAAGLYRPHTCGSTQKWSGSLWAPEAAEHVSRSEEVTTQVQSERERHR